MFFLPLDLPKGTTVRQGVRWASVGFGFSWADPLTNCGWLRPGRAGGKTPGTLGTKGLPRDPYGRRLGQVT